MIALLIVIAGYCLIFGARGAFDKLLRSAVGLILILTFLPGLLIRCEHEVSRLEVPRPDFEFDIAAWILAVLGLGLIGGLAWKLRPVLAKRRESRLRRDGHPRGRALPPPPPPGDEDEEDW